MRPHNERPVEPGDASAHQPADPADRLRTPARDPACSAIRELLRDHADGDLDLDDAARVETHVHGCHDCGLALRRAQLEVQLVKRAFEAGRADLIAAVDEFIADEGFSSRVIGRLGDAEGAAVSAPAEFTRRVMERVRMEWQPRGAWRRFTERFGPRRAALLAAGVPIVVATGLMLLAGEPVLPGGAYVVESTDATWSPPGSSRPVGPVPPGTRLADGAVLRTGDAGSARLELVDERVGPDLGVVPEVALGSSTTIRAHRGGLGLVAGAVAIDAAVDLVVQIEEVAVVRLRAGRYHVSVESVRRFDAALLPSDVARARVEVFEGGAEIVRGADRPSLVAAGCVAWVDPLSPVRTERSVDTLLPGGGVSTELIAAEPGARGSPALGPGEWRGRVVHAATGRGVPGARVHVADGRPGASQVTATDADGWFRFRADDLAIAVVRVVPSPADPALASFGPEPVRPTLAQRARRELAAIALPDGVAVGGRVRTWDNRWVAGARVVPCLVDEIFGLVEPLGEAADTDADGRFRMRALPRASGRHQRVALVVSDRRHPTTAFLELGDRGRQLPLDLCVQPARTVQLAGLPADGRLTVVESIPGLPTFAMATVHEVATDAAGRCALQGAGGGRLWLADRAAGGVRALVARISAGAEVFVPDGPSWRPRGADRLFGTDELIAGEGSARLLASGHRYASARPPAGLGGMHLAVHDSDRVGAPPAQLFVRLADGSIQYLGEYDGVSSVSFAEPAERPFSVFAIGADGSVGWVDGDALLGGNVSIPVRSPGDVVLSESFRNELARRGDPTMLAFELTDGPLQGQTFWRSADPIGDWAIDGLVPGRYRVVYPDGTERLCVVESGKQIVLDPRAAAKTEDR